MYSEKALKNVNYNVISMAITALATFVVRTVFIKYLGEEILGINATIVDTVNLLTMSEMGIETAIIYKMYKPIIDGDYDRQSILFNLYKKAYKTVALIILTAGLLLLPFIPKVINTNINIHIVYQAYIMQLLLVSCTYFVSYYKIVLLAHQRQYIYTRFELVVNVICSILKYVVIVYFKSYTLYLITGYVALILNTTYIIYKTKKDYGLIIKKSDVPKEDLQSMISDLKKMIIITISGYVYGSTDNILISMFFGSTLVGLISNYKVVTSMIKSVVVSYISSSVAPSWGTFLHSSPAENVVLEKYSLFTFVEFTVGAVLLLPTWLLINDFIILWLGKTFTISSVIIDLVIVEIFMTSISEPNAVIMRNIGLFSQENIGSCSAMVVNIIASITLAIKIGVAGIFIGTILADIIYTIVRSISVNSACFKGSKKTLVKYIVEYLSYMTFFVVVYVLLNTIYRKMFVQVSIVNFVIKGIISEIVIVGLIMVLWHRTNKINQMIRIIKK